MNKSIKLIYILKALLADWKLMHFFLFVYVKSVVCIEKNVLKKRNWRSLKFLFFITFCGKLKNLNGDKISYKYIL